MLEKRVLVIDDEEVVRNVCHRSLEKQDYQIELAQNGAQALELMRKQPFDVVFTDLKMPIMDGVELLETVKRDYPFSQVIVMTAYATVKSAIEAMKIGAYDFILKPIKPDQIRLVVEKCFERMQLDAENESLRDANQKLQDLQSMKDKFIAITSHELRTPVSHLKGFLGILDKEVFYSISEEERDQCMQVIFNAVDELEGIVTGMHELLHFEDDPYALAATPVEVNSLLVRVVDEYKLIASKRKQTLNLKPCDTGITVVADAGQIQNVVRELIQNAIKFTPDLGKVEVRAEKEGDYGVIHVEDNGIGIDKLEQGKIFEKFYEVQNIKYHSSSKDNFMGGGLGLGLPSVRAIANAYGGAVKVRSEKSKGADFMVYLPLEK
ncbi:response regulator [bacterium]|nr:response regulator [bacterium]